MPRSRSFTVADGDCDFLSTRRSTHPTRRTGATPEKFPKNWGGERSTCSRCTWSPEGGSRCGKCKMYSGATLSEKLPPKKTGPDVERFGRETNLAGQVGPLEGNRSRCGYGVDGRRQRRPNRNRAVSMPSRLSSRSSAAIASGVLVLDMVPPGNGSLLRKWSEFEGLRKLELHRVLFCVRPPARPGSRSRMGEAEERSRQGVP